MTTLENQQNTTENTQTENLHIASETTNSGQQSERPNKYSIPYLTGFRASATWTLLSLRSFQPH